MNVLVIDDSPDMRDVLSSELTRRGCQVTTAKHGGIALDVISENGLPDLILVDIQMPVLDGPGFITAFRKGYANATVPIVLISALANVEEIAQSANAEQGLSKSDILDKLDTILNKYRA